MEFLRQTISSDELSSIFDIPPALCNKRVEVIVLPEESDMPKKQKYEVRIGFLDGPPLPDSFFDPLPEEDLQSWGL